MALEEGGTEAEGGKKERERTDRNAGEEEKETKEAGKA